jgi:hypothetical protein
MRCACAGSDQEMSEVEPIRRAGRPRAGCGSITDFSLAGSQSGQPCDVVSRLGQRGSWTGSSRISNPNGQPEQEVPPMLTFGERRRGGNCNEVRSQSGGQLMHSRHHLFSLAGSQSGQPCDVVSRLGQRGSWTGSYYALCVCGQRSRDERSGADSASGPTEGRLRVNYPSSPSRPRQVRASPPPLRSTCNPKLTVRLRLLSESVHSGAVLCAVRVRAAIKR